MKRDKYIYIGLDLHKFQHTAVILDCWNEKLGEMTFQNKTSIFPSLLEYVNRYLTEGLTPVFGLEDVGGYGRGLALYLIEQGYNVKFVNSSLSNAERNSYAMTQKNDSWDAQCEARVLIRDLPYLPVATPYDIYWIIAQLVGRRNALVKAQTALKNQLHIQLNYHYPSYKDFFSEVDGKTALAFWESYPSPSHLEGKTMEGLLTFLLEASNNACSTRKAEQILSLVQADGEVKREYQTTRDFITQSMVRDIRFKKQEIKKVVKELKLTIQTLGMQLETMPGIDTVTSSALIAEIGDIHRFANSDKLARYAGIAPIRMGSGGKETMKKTKQGNRKLYETFYNLAVQVQVCKGSKIPRNRVFYAYYNQKLSEGKSKSQALLCIMRRLVRIIYGMMKNKTAYIMPDQVDTKAS
ncbi:IS110 family transposase [Oceanobacillus sp. J11TS1]|nr:IS110 family transposase [Oceanobacillus sp. J11TS1]GIO24693.1 IS110 family transposase [Oceanobacillus sp. J11TS1]